MAVLLFKFLYEGVAGVLWLWHRVENGETEFILGFKLVLALFKEKVFDSCKAEAASSLRYEVDGENFLQVE